MCVWRGLCCRDIAVGVVCSSEANHLVDKEVHLFWFIPLKVSDLNEARSMRFSVVSLLLNFLYVTNISCIVPFMENWNMHLDCDN